MNNFMYSFTDYNGRKANLLLAKMNENRKK